MTLYVCGTACLDHCTSENKAFMLIDRVLLLLSLKGRFSGKIFEKEN